MLLMHGTFRAAALTKLGFAFGFSRDLFYKLLTRLILTSTSVLAITNIITGPKQLPQLFLSWGTWLRGGKTVCGFKFVARDIFL